MQNIMILITIHQNKIWIKNFSFYENRNKNNKNNDKNNYYVDEEVIYSNGEKEIL